MDIEQKDKELLIKDLSGRIPYRHNFWLQVREFDEDVPSNRRMHTDYIDEIDNGWIVECKPYLRPISSMTEEEKEELRDTYDWIYSEYPWDDEDEDPDDVGCHPEPSAETYDWYNRKMFDYRGLIPLGLALEAPECMYDKLK